MCVLYIYISIAEFLGVKLTMDNLSHWIGFRESYGKAWSSFIFILVIREGYQWVS